MTEEPALQEAAEAYLRNDENRAIFERCAQFTAISGGDAAAYVLGDDYLQTAQHELATLAPRWESRLTAPVQRILDAGCSTGVTALALARRYPDAEVVGIDVEQEAIELARRLAAREGLRCRFETVAVEQFTDDAGFDLIHCREVIEHVFSPAEAVRVLLGLLRPGGVAYFEMPNYLWPFEPHLRMRMLPRSPKWLLALQCRATGRDASFLDHLNTACNPTTVRRWIREADRGREVRVVDLMAEKTRDIFAAREEPVVEKRARVVRVLRRHPRVAAVTEWTLTRLPVTPSVMLLVVRNTTGSP